MNFEAVSHGLEPSLDESGILVAGVGGGGTNAITHMVETWAQGPRRVAIHTNAQALREASAHEQIQIGESITKGVSTGGDVAAGKASAESDETKLRALFSAVKLCFLTVSLGGGTGTGAGPVVARIAREEEALVIVFATLPFSFEGEERLRMALKGLAALRETADLVIVLPNDRLREVDPDRGAGEAFRKSDQYLGGCVQAIWHLLTRRTLIRLDFAHMKTMAEQSSGLCAFARAEASGPERVQQLVDALLHSPYLAKGHVISRAQGLLVAIRGGPDLSLAMVDRFMQTLRSVLPSDCRFHFGLSIDDAFQNRMEVTVLASEVWSELDAMARYETEASQTEPVQEEAPIGPNGKKVAKKKAVQTSLNLEPAGKGRFKDVEPTYHAGEDLDYPTFMRRGIKLTGVE